MASEGRARRRGGGSLSAMRAPFLVKALAAVLVGLHSFAAPGRAQMALPFTGQGTPPSEPVDVYVSAMMVSEEARASGRRKNVCRLPLGRGDNAISFRVSCAAKENREQKEKAKMTRHTNPLGVLFSLSPQERLLEVDDRNYRFENVVYLYLSWEDGRAAQAVRDSTVAFRNGSVDQCNRPCYSGGPLSKETIGFTPQDSCCDGIWLPTIGMLNVYELPEGRLQPYGIIVDQLGQGVAWWTAIHAVYFTPVSTHTNPLCRQLLLRPSERTFSPGLFLPIINAF